MTSLLIVEHDPNIADLARLVLANEGYQVAVLSDTRIEALQVAVGQLEPDCILLGGSPGGYGGSWDAAAWLNDRARSMPTIMVTAEQREANESLLSQTARSQAAGFQAVLSQPFNLDELLETVARCVKGSVPFDRSDQADADRTAALVERLWAVGARDIRPSTRREWVQFRTAGQALVLVYWSQRDGVYYVMQYAASGRVERVGQFYDRDAAISLAVSVTVRPAGAPDHPEQPAGQAGPAPDS